MAPSQQSSPRSSAPLVGQVDATLTEVLTSTDTLIAPVRQTVFKRFPALFLLLVTFGISAVVFAFERLLMEWTYLNDRPWLILLLGIAVLVFTGRLYKKLG